VNVGNGVNVELSINYMLSLSNIELLLITIFYPTQGHCPLKGTVVNDVAGKYRILT